MRFLILLIGGLLIMFYSVIRHKKGRRTFNFIAYWTSLSPKGAVLYTVGLALILFALLY